MNERYLGRGAFWYVTALTFFNAVIMFILYVFVDVPALMAQPGWHRLFGIGGALFIAELLVFVVWNCVLTVGWQKTFWAFILTFLIAFTAEALGVNFGLVFGHYYYSDFLGYKVFGVPIVVALAWEPIMYASFYVTEILVPSEVDKSAPLAKRLMPYLGLCVVGALATTAWDLMIDPVAVSQGWWTWVDGGPYATYIRGGVPISNFMGWMGVAFVCHVVCVLIKDSGPNKPKYGLYLSIYGPLMCYCLLLLCGLGSAVLILRRMDIALIGLMSMGVITLVALTRVNLIQRRVEPFPGEEYIKTEPGIERYLPERYQKS